MKEKRETKEGLVNGLGLAFILLIELNSKARVYIRIISQSQDRLDKADVRLRSQLVQLRQSVPCAVLRTEVRVDERQTMADGEIDSSAPGCP